MNKEYLKRVWGNYTDTDKVVDDIMALLTEYGHRNSEHGVCVMLDEYFKNKKPLIELLSKSANYKGDLRIVMTKEFARDEQKDEVFDFCSNFISKVGAAKLLLKTKDENGKTVMDYSKVNIKTFNVKDLHNADFASTLNASAEELRRCMSNFALDGYTVKSRQRYDLFKQLIYQMRFMSNNALTESDAYDLRWLDNNLKVVAGMKTSRAFNRICTDYGINKAKGYNKLFAKYSDLVSSLTRKLKFVISVNPYDYLTMSFGNSWASCHTIDKANKRRMDNSYSGMYCNGTTSYMLDGSSIITYCVGDNEDVQTAGKIYRNMFHFENNTLVQGRVYPQSKDGSTDLYAMFRNFVQTELSMLLDLNGNKWTIARGASKCADYTASTGNHYRDYRTFNDCNISYPSVYKEDGTAPQTVHIGHEGICAYCGKLLNSSSDLAHNSCSLPITEPIVEPIDEIISTLDVAEDTVIRLRNDAVSIVIGDVEWTSISDMGDDE